MQANQKEGDPQIAIVEALESFTLLGPDGRQVETSEYLQFISPAISHGAMNTVVRARFSGEMDAKIASILRPYEEGALNCWWMIGPNSLYPEKIEARLRTLGFELEHEAFGLMMPTNHELQLAVEPRVSVEKVTKESLIDYLRAARDGREPSASYRAYFEWLMKLQGEKLEIFLSRVDGEPAGTGLLQLFGQSANLVSGYVRPKFRGRGAYRALIKARVESLRKRNIPRAVVLSKTQTSAPILMRMGFTKVCELRTLELKLSKVRWET